ncbi:MAG: SIS domain-containing protein [Clostridia bacterium]|nr:SIS domain-containing protein [Clostridia bacterium]MBP3583222.1 SIS domain-containing protein [Clostridia bacterium]MBQ8584449.1 SIS domain-containing protein [Clostridia bacterium]
MESALNQAFDAFRIEAESLLETAKVLDREEMRRAVEVLAKAERIAASGCGHSGIACRHFAHLMCCAERPARFLSPAEAVHGGLGCMKKGDVMIMASRGGKTDELMTIIDVCKTKGVTLIGVTENLESPLAKSSDIVLAMKVTKECDKYNCQGTTSFAVTSAIFDALQTALIEYTGYQKMDFALIHPGGAVGKRLNNK